MTKSKFVQLLQNAHAGERAAAYAYRGHSLSVNAKEANEIKKIEIEEWEHREKIAEMLHELGASPRQFRELLMAAIGLGIFLLCRLGGWFNLFNFGWYFSMFGAGKLERGNIVEYEIAARYAVEAGYSKYVDCLLNMAEVEWDHELYFRTKCLESGSSKHVKVWLAPPTRASIRNDFEKLPLALAIVNNPLGRKKVEL